MTQESILRQAIEKLTLTNEKLISELKDSSAQDRKRHIHLLKKNKALILDYKFRLTHYQL